MEQPELIVKDAAAWRAWLDAHEFDSDGVWLVLANKGTVSPTSLTYAQALDEALCSGWIDGQRRGRDASTSTQRFTPRRKRSLWSVRNIGLIGILQAESRLRPRGQQEVDLAKKDGRWAAAYTGSGAVRVPKPLAAALSSAEGAEIFFADAGRAAQYAAIHWVNMAPTAEEKDRRVGRIATMAAAQESWLSTTGHTTFQQQS